MVIAIDLDDTLLDLATPLEQVWAFTGGGPRDMLRCDWGNGACYAASLAYLARSSGWAAINAHRGAERVLEWVAMAGHEVYYVSERPQDAYDATAAGLRREDLLDFGELWICGDTQRKHSAVLELMPDVLIDDDPAAAVLAMSRGIRTIVYAQPWNECLCGIDALAVAIQWMRDRNSVADLLGVTRRS